MAAKGPSTKQKLLTFGRKSWWVVAVVVFSIGIGVTLFQSDLNPNAAKKPRVTPKQCVGVTEEPFECWYARYNTIVEQDSTQAAFADLRKVYETDGYIKANCHQLAHVIGHAAFKRYKDVALAYEQGDNFCWSGFYHGVMEEVAQTMGREKVLSQLNTICAGVAEKQAYGFDHYNCVHGMGHGLMAITDNELFMALNDCEGLEGTWEQDSCYSGVFMENVMTKVRAGHAETKYLKADQPLYPCTAVKTQYKQQCYLMQTSYALTVSDEDFSRVFALCATVASPFDVDCYQSLGRDASGRSSSNQEMTIASCNLGETRFARENCFIGAVKDFISYYHGDEEGLELCNAITEGPIKTTCLTTARDYYQLL